MSFCNRFGLSVIGLGRRSSGVWLGFVYVHPNVVSSCSIDSSSSCLDFNSQDLALRTHVGQLPELPTLSLAAP